MTQTEVVIGYGSLVSKKGITREGSAPRIHEVWAVVLPGRRGFSKTFRGGRKVVLDAFLDEAKVLQARPLVGFLDGATEGTEVPRPELEEQPAFAGVALEIDAVDWAWYDAREEFPVGLGARLAHERDASGRPVATILAEVMAEAGLEDYPRALHRRYQEHLGDPSWETFRTHYIPYPMRLPEHDTNGDLMPHDWGIVCAVPAKELPHQKASIAAAASGVDPVELLWYYHDCLLARAHGIDMRDLVDPDLEAVHPELQTMLEHHMEEERRPLGWFLGNLPRGAGRSEEDRPGAPPSHGMRPLEHLVPFDEAQRLLGSLPLQPLPIDEVPLDGADGRVLAEAVRSTVDVPAFDKSAMDGYAVRAEDTYGASLHGPRKVRCVGVQHAGPLDGRLEVETGTCIQIATGAPLPRGADAVVMVEATRRDADTVEVLRPQAPHQNVIKAGSDIKQGRPIGTAGERLDPMRVAGLAACGVAHVHVFARPRVAVLSTGDEVVPPGRPVGPGQVHDANNHALAAFCRRHGAEVTRIAGVPDTDKAIRSALAQGLEDHDLVLVTGGTSAGERDLLPDILREMGEVLFHGIRIRPGKPVVAAVVAGRPVIGLPGYPTSCLLVAERFVAPLLHRVGGETRPRVRGTVQKTLSEAIQGQGDWHRFIPVRLDGEDAIPCFRGSAAVTSLSEADGFIEIESGATGVAVGAAVIVHLFS